MPTKDSNTPRVLFHEEQRFRQPVLWVVLVVFASFSLGTTLYLLTNKPAGPDAAAEMSELTWTSLLLLGIVPASGTLLLFALARYQVEVSTRGLFIRFYPLHWKVRKVDLAGVVRVEAVQYHPIRDYGGYGVRRLPRAKAYNTGGNQGVRIHYENGYHLLLGTNFPNELELALKQLLSATGAAKTTSAGE